MQEFLSNYNPMSQRSSRNAEKQSKKKRSLQDQISEHEKISEANGEEPEEDNQEQIHENKVQSSLLSNIKDNGSQIVES